MKNILSFMWGLGSAIFLISIISIIITGEIEQDIISYGTGFVLGCFIIFIERKDGTQLWEPRGELKNEKSET